MISNCMLIQGVVNSCIARRTDIDGAMQDGLVPLPVFEGNTYYALTEDNISGYWLCVGDGKVGFTLGFNLTVGAPVSLLIPKWLSEFEYGSHTVVASKQVSLWTTYFFSGYTHHNGKSWNSQLFNDMASIFPIVCSKNVIYIWLIFQGGLEGKMWLQFDGVYWIPLTVRN